MGDEKYFTIQVKGTAYRFRPFPEDDIAMVVTVFGMGVGISHSMKALAGPLSESLGDEQWDAMVNRMVRKELTASDLAEAFKTVLKRQTTPKAKATKAKGLDVASTRLVPADDAE